MTKVSASNSFNNANEIRDMFVEIVNKNTGYKYEPPRESILELEVSFKDDTILAYIQINDENDIKNIMGDTKDAEITIFIMDIYEKFLLRKFKIIDTNRQMGAQKNSISFILRDIISYNLDNLYISSTYKSMKLSDIMRDIFYKYKISDESYILFDFNSSLIIDNFVITPNKSVLNILKDEFIRQGLICYQSRNNFILNTYKNMIPDKLDEIEQQYDDLKKELINPYDIFQYKIFDAAPMIKIPKSQVLVYDKKTKTMKTFKCNIEDMGFDIPEDAQITDGKEYTTQEYLTDDNLFANTYKTFIDNEKITFISSTSIENIDMYKKINLLLRGKPLNDTTSLEGDVNYSGKYIITGFVDKVVTGKYLITKINASRFKK